MRIPIVSNWECPKRDGSVLILTIVLFAFAALYLSTYLLVIQSEANSVARSQAWNNSMVLAEAGVEEALALVNKNTGLVGGFTNWQANAVSADHWTLLSNNVYSMTRYLGSTATTSNLGYYTVYVTNTISGSNNGPSILSVGYSTWNASRSTFTASQPIRKVYVQTRRDGLISGNLAAISTVNFNGNNVIIDSFDSGDPYHSDWQTNKTYHGTNYYGTYPANPGNNTSVSAPDYAYEPFMRKDNAFVTTDGAVINVGNGDVWGYANTAPGGTTSVGANGSVGDVFYVPTQGIQAGHGFSDMNVIFPDVILPTNSWTTLSKLNGGSAYTYGGYTFKYVINSGGNYQITSQVSDPIYIQGTNVVLYLPAGLNWHGNSGTIWLETNSDVTIYSGNDIDTSGQIGINNISQYAPAFAIYGLPSCHNITFGGQATITAYVYAPSAALALNGGGSGYYHSVGAFFVKSVVLTGNMGFHYDEALRLLGPSRAYIPVVWQEVN
jgi:hypothetical protein